MTAAACLEKMKELFSMEASDVLAMDRVIWMRGSMANTLADAIAGMEPATCCAHCQRIAQV